MELNNAHDSSHDGTNQDVSEESHKGYLDNVDDQQSVDASSTHIMHIGSDLLPRDRLNELEMAAANSADNINLSGDPDNEEEISDEKSCHVMAVLQTFVYADVQKYDKKDQSIVPSPVKVLLKLYKRHTVMDDYVTENTFYRLLHRHIRHLAAIAAQVEKKQPHTLQGLVKDKLRKAKLEFGARYQLHYDNVYNGLMICLPDPDDSSPSYLEFVSYLNAHEIAQIDNLNELETEMKKRKSIQSLTPPKLAKNQKQDGKKKAIRPAVFPLELSIPPPVQMYPGENDIYIVQILKIPGTTLQLTGPDEDLCYTVTGNYPVRENCDFNGIPSGDVRFMFRVPATCETPPNSLVEKQEKDGLVTLVFYSKKLTSQSGSLL